jgi:hypothetical protein
MSSPARRAPWSYLAAAAGLTAVVAFLALSAPGHARAAAESSKCEQEHFLYELASAAVAGRLMPNDATEIPEVTEGDPMKLSGESEWPLTFQLASSEAELSERHYAETGTGTKQPETTPPLYTFTSTKATEEAGLVYWQASFTHTLPNCENETATFTTRPPDFGVKAVTFLVTPRPVEVPGPEAPPSEPGPSTGPTTSWTGQTSSPAHLRVGITAAHIVHAGAHEVAYLVDCTAACAGKTYFRASLLRRHSKTRPLKALDLSARDVEVRGHTGGDERFTFTFRGRALAKLRSVLRAGGQVRLELVATVEDSYGKTTTVHRVVVLRR